MSAKNLRTESYHYCELCWTTPDKPDEPMVVMDYPDENGDWVEIHFCKACLEKMLALLEEA